ncbi:MAG: DUF1122 family protein [Thermofilaceae archaeon]|nr:DUF1122 family protein [Thermofilaceae archaeon]MCX8181349.1 DUF1122 family protein [Thermofilaceae archaeon]MDW8003592.1 DUF1122 family protein [Thermofilaceae archaeon]
MLCKSSLNLLKNTLRIEVVEKPGRFVEERNFELYSGGSRLLVLKCFNGRPPFYGRWVEVFNVVKTFQLEGTSLPFAGSDYEKTLLSFLAGELKPGETLFIEYGYDLETERLLRLGAPSVLTRLGFLLLQLGFTRFRDWYYPEGFMEGGQKLQCDKPLDGEARARHLKQLIEEVVSYTPYLTDLRGREGFRGIIVEAIKRAELITSGRLA